MNVKIDNFLAEYSKLSAEKAGRLKDVVIETLKDKAAELESEVFRLREENRMLKAYLRRKSKKRQLCGG